MTPFASLQPGTVRSALYVPASNSRALQKAANLGADILILDLEDAVSPSDKISARASLCAALPELQRSNARIIVRINDLSTPWGREDLSAVIAAKTESILVPKIESAQDLLDVDTVINHITLSEAITQGPRLWAMIETPRAVINALSIADVARTTTVPLTGFILGLNDLCKETGVRVVPDRSNLIPWIAMSVAAARAAGILILDGVCNRIQADREFQQECRQARDLGLDGKTLIHPGQVSMCNSAFAPSEEQIAWAEAVVEAFAHPENDDVGVLVVDGEMVERLHLDLAKRLLALRQR
ncbi:HpcH/HpaI aldolase/citrate lyase family protein [Paraburkholderia phenoliruptrix]|uniref:HpcH/HpaI aldolase/citrate lyase family protein n=1 Tax=Paraburkholderia phenoliruptrix TaxID=252970 RepID=UPI002869C2F9|nr:CoA ester lyase [Paraburkholderia phenoliruptrix]WMY11029.1 CoA ester lyase [Paraburkholderia phenoliruptrix]